MNTKMYDFINININIFNLKKYLLWRLLLFTQLLMS